MKDQTILAVYSHMLNSPLYLSNYAFGNVIEFQLEEQLKGKSFPNEVDRIFKQGRLTPNQWMIEATGSKLSTQPMIDAARESVKSLQN
jgi:oligoendopeptidase F